MKLSVSSLSKIAMTTLFVLFFLMGSVVSAGDYYRQIGLAGNMSACETIGGKAVSTIIDPAKIIAAGLSGSKAGDKLEVTRISENQILLKNLHTGFTIKLGYGYEGTAAGGSGYLGKEFSDNLGTSE